MRNTILVGGLLLSLSATAAGPQNPIPPGDGPVSPGVRFDYTAEDILTNCDTMIETAEAAFEKVANKTRKRTFENTVARLEDAVAALDAAISPVYLLKEVSTSTEVQEAGQKCLEKFEALMAKTRARADLFKGVDDVRKMNLRLDEQDQKLLDEWLLTFKLSGAGLSPEVRAQVVALKEEQSKAELEFQNNVSSANDTVAMSLEELEGVPQSLIDGLTADSDGRKLLMLTKSAHVLTFLQNAKKESARKKFVETQERVVASKNVPLLEKAIRLRTQISKLMGFSNHGELALQTRMAKTSGEVISFLDDLGSKLVPLRDKELNVLLDLKKKDDPSATVLNTWDWRYYDNQLQKTRYSVDNEKIREYFPMDHVVTSVFDIYQTILEVKFVEIKPAMAWAPDVRLFEIRDTKTKTLVGHFYLDLFPRDNKYNHFAAFTIRSGRRSADGGYISPVSAVVGNWPKPVGDKPSLISHSDVETFFHEFGHIMHQTLTRARYVSFSGSSVRRDFVEAPSQMLEGWAWDGSILKKVSKHYKTGEPLPQEMLQKMIDAKLVNVGIKTMRQVFFAKTDMEYHTQGEAVDTTAIWKRNWKSILGMDPTSEGQPQATFGHLMGGYDAGYYGYLWSEVYAADMFTEFEKAGLENPAIGRRYRTWILESGGSKEPMDLLRGFLGREPNNEAFLRSLGLKN